MIIVSKSVYHDLNVRFLGVLSYPVVTGASGGDLNSMLSNEEVANLIEAKAVIAGE